MKMLIAKIMHHILRFSYPYLMDIERECHDRELSALKSKFRHFGHYSSLGANPFVYGAENISIGDRLIAKRYLRIEAISERNGQTYNPHLIIGNDVIFGDYCHVGCFYRVVIGDGTTIASKVFITDHNHGEINKNALSVRPTLRPLSGKPVIIGKNVWVGESVSIMPGVTLGDNVIVGANSVVTHSFPADVVIAGCPAKIIKQL